MQILATITVFQRLSDINLNFIGKAIKWLIELGGNVGVGVILFTLALKLITLPLDIYSRVTMRKSSLKMEKMRPQLEKLKVQYANDKGLYSQKMMELYKKEGYSMFSACLPTLVTLVFFIIVITAFNSYSKFATLDTFNNMRESYTSTVYEYTGGKTDITQADANRLGLATEAEAIDFIKGKAREAAAEEYRSTNLKFLWVKNIWLSDNATMRPVLSHKKFSEKIGKLSNGETFNLGAYEEITHNLTKEKSQPNGYFVLIALAIGVTFLSQLVMTKSQKTQMELQSVDGQSAQTQKIMMYMMPVMMGIFAFMYTSAFCIYMITNSILTIVTTLLINKFVDIGFKRRELKEEHSRLNQRYNRVKGGGYRKK